MSLMRGDMGGAATVCASALAIAQLQVPYARVSPVVFLYAHTLVSALTSSCSPRSRRTCLVPLRTSLETCESRVMHRRIFISDIQSVAYTR